MLPIAGPEWTGVFGHVASALSVCGGICPVDRRLVSCRVVPCRAVPCRAVPCRAVPCRSRPLRLRATPTERTATGCCEVLDGDQ